MNSLEMKGMIRYCHPQTPMLGIFRTTCCPIRTRESHKKAIIARDKGCFPSMLHKMVSKFKAYRATRRLRIQAIHKILSKGLFCNYLTYFIMDFLSHKKKDNILIPPLMYYPMEISETTSIRQRFLQMSGRLIYLGYAGLVLPEIEDYEHELYLSFCHKQLHPKITAMYHQLNQKRIKNKWRIIFSYLQTLNSFGVYELPLYQTGDRWDYYCSTKRISIYFDKCLKLSRLSHEEHELIQMWFSYLKHSMY